MKSYYTGEGGGGGGGEWVDEILLYGLNVERIRARESFLSSKETRSLRL